MGQHEPPESAVDPTHEQCLSAPEVALRRIAHAVGSLLPDDVQYRSFAWLKRIKGRLRKRDPARLMAAWDGLAQARVETTVFRGTYAVTHDVDYKACYDFIPELLDLDDALGIKATFNFLTHAGYRIEGSLLAEIRRRGHAIGLHGRTHDRALGSRSYGQIRDFVTDSRNQLQDRLGEPVNGFRTPALAMSPRLLFVLEELGFRYDSSATTCRLHSSFTDRAAPHHPPGLGLTEIPMTIQDSLYINDIPTPLHDMIRLYGHIALLSDGARVPIVANFHPVIAHSHTAAYRAAVEALKAGSRRNVLMEHYTLPRDKGATT